MKVSFGTFGDTYVGRRMRDFVRDLENALLRAYAGGDLVIGGGAKIEKHMSATASLNFAAPTGVPGIATGTATITVTGAALGDEVSVSASIATPANFLPPTGYVSATDTVTVVWFQYAGVAADPDGAGATYRASVWRH